MTPPAPVPGLGSLEGLDSTQRTMHQGALDILQRHDTEGRPFALFLRTFGVGFLYGDPENPRLLENCLREGLWARGQLPIVTVQMRKVDVGYESPALTREPRRRWLPSLVVDDERWLETVSYVIERADLIVSEVVTSAAGVMQELDAIQRHGRDDRAVVVLPPPGSAIANDDEEALGARFARIVHSDEIDADDPLRMFVFRDLVDRMQRMDRNREQAGSRDVKLPIRAAGLEGGYARLAERLRDSKAWPSAAIAHAKAAAIARLARRPPQEHLYRSAEMWARCGNWDGAMKAIRQAETLLDASRGGELRKSIVALRADILRARGKWTAGLALLRTAIREARAARNPELEGFLLLVFARYVFHLRRLTGVAAREAMAACRRAIRLARRRADRVGEIEALKSMGMIAWRAGDFSAAGTVFEHALERIGRRQGQIQCSLLINLGRTRMEQQQRGAAESALRDAYALARKHRYPELLRAAIQALKELGVPVDRPRWLDRGPRREQPKIVLFTPAD